MKILTGRLQLLEAYMQGFEDELQNNPIQEYDYVTKQRAYELGRIDALIGDNVRSVDYQSEEHLFQRIKNIPQ